MIVNEIMKKDVATCAPSDDLAKASKIMRDRQCGFLPVVASDGAVAGVLTDRDICLHAAETPRSLAHLAVRDTMSHPVFSCLAEDNVKAAISAMSVHHVHRLPVIDKAGHLKGVLSIDDVIEAPHRRGTPTVQEIVTVLKSINAPRKIEMATA
jgi:CBS domain-containing protein